MRMVLVVVLALSGNIAWGQTEWHNIQRRNAAIRLSEQQNVLLYNASQQRAYEAQRQQMLLAQIAAREGQKQQQSVVVAPSGGAPIVIVRPDSEGIARRDADIAALDAKVEDAAAYATGRLLISQRQAREYESLEAEHEKLKSDIRAILDKPAKYTVMLDAIRVLVSPPSPPLER